MKLRRVARVLGALVLAAIAIAVVAGWHGFGRRVTGARRARMERSPQWSNGHFVNPQPLVNDVVGALTGALHASPYTSPSPPLPAFTVDPRRFDAPPPSGLRVTWLGHSTTLVEIDGARVLTDPIFGERASPLSSVGPLRWYPPPIALADLPPIDAVVISHDHYDHLDEHTLSAMKDWKTTFVVPLGVGAHLAYWGIPEARIVELDWWERAKVGALDVVCTPARHASGRTMIGDKDATLWAGYALVGAAHRVYFSGDTGLFPAMKDIGARLGPFDLTMIEVGQYHRAWPDWHIGPEQAVEAHQLVRGRVMLPIHWGLFALAYHGWTEPAERALVAARSATTITTPRPGESVEPTSTSGPTPWWPTVPWQTAREHPIVSSQAR